MNFKFNIPLFYLLFFSTTFLLSVLINSIFLNFSTNLGIRKNQNVQIRWNPEAKPALGGISFYVIFLITLSFLGITNTVSPEGLVNSKILGVMASVTIAFVMGLADDAFDTNPLLKFSTQFLCALILILTDNRIHCFSSEFLNYTITVFWIIGIMNSINMLDNMDGITTIVSISIMTLTGILSIHFDKSLSYIAILDIGILGSLCGFLLYNWNPSKLFMGDAGSQFLGIFLGIIGIDYFWNFSSSSFLDDALDFSPQINFLLISLVFIIPLSDTISVVINRIRQGRSPFVGGRDHSTHKLFLFGLSEKKIALLLFFLSSLAGLLVYFIVTDTRISFNKLCMYSLIPALIFSFLFVVTTIKKNER